MHNRVKKYYIEFKPYLVVLVQKPSTITLILFCRLMVDLSHTQIQMIHEADQCTAVAYHKLLEARLSCRNNEMLE